MKVGSRRTRTPVDEASNSLVLLILILPMILAAFGLGVDISRNVYVRDSLQNALDTATAAGAAAVRNQPSGGLDFTPAVATRVTRAMYALDRMNGPATTCIGSGAFLPGTPGLRMCWQEPAGPPRIDAAAGMLIYTVREQTRNAFLGMVGIPVQTYTLVSKARINQTDQ